MITGNSVHNARIERLWRDLRRIVVRPFANLFYYMEDCSLLDTTVDTQLFALHYVYLPRINLSLREFILQYNHHPLRTVHNQSPFQYFMKECYNFPRTLALEASLKDKFLTLIMELMRRHQYQLHKLVMITLLKLSALGILYIKITMSNYLWRWTPLKMTENMEFLCMLECWPLSIIILSYRVTLKQETITFNFRSITIILLYSISISLLYYCMMWKSAKTKIIIIILYSS